jgi:hypothetical protein
LGTLQKGTEPWEQKLQSLTVLGTLVDELLLEVSNNNKAFELAALESNEDIEIFFLENVKINA